MLIPKLTSDISGYILLLYNLYVMHWLAHAGIKKSIPLIYSGIFNYTKYITPQMLYTWHFVS